MGITKMMNSFENPFVKPHNNPLPAIDDNTLTAEIKPFSWNVIRLKKEQQIIKTLHKIKNMLK